MLTAYVVDSLSDTVAADGHLSLREAILASNLNVAVNEAAAGQGGGVTDTITFATSVAGGTIALAGTELSISDHLAVYGPVTVSGDLNSRVFSVAAGASVTLAGLTITGGGGRDADPSRAVAEGAGVYNAGTLLLAGCLLTNNVARSAGGAAVNAVGGTLAVVGCGFAGNRSGNTGGAVFNNGSLSLADSALTDNAGDGALYNASTASAARVLVSKNGSGVVNTGTLRVAESRITENGDTGLWTAGQADVYGSVIYGNAKADRTGAGGGIWNGGNDQHQGVLVLRDSVVSFNAGSSGGGIVNARAGVMTVSNCLVTGNGAASAVSSGGNGGGIRNSGVLTVANSAVVKNSAGGSGGGIWTGRTFDTGLFSDDTVTLTVADSLITQNTAERSGGGVAVADFGGRVVINRSTLAGNEAATGGGISNGWVLEVYNSTLSGNYASHFGGGVYETELAALYNVTVFGNRAGEAGGGLYFQGVEYPTPSGPHPNGGFGYKLVNTIVAGNRRGTAGTEGTPDDGGGTGHNNLIGDAATAGGMTDGVNGNIVGVDWRAVLDPVLRYNGGLTPTHALIADSRAIDAGSDVALPTDQRGSGFPRRIGEAVDVGAYELLYSAVGSAGGGALRTQDDEPLSAFWSQADRDEAFAVGLLAAG